jgi:hypothetical protein
MALFGEKLKKIPPFSDQTISHLFVADPLKSNWNFKGHHIIFGEIVVPGATYLEPLGTGELLNTLDDSRAITSGLNIMIHHETSVSQKSFHV